MCYLIGFANSIKTDSIIFLTKSFYKMNSLIKSVSAQLIRHHRQFLIQTSYFATDLKKIEELTKKNKVVVFMKV